MTNWRKASIAVVGAGVLFATAACGENEPGGDATGPAAAQSDAAGAASDAGAAGGEAGGASGKLGVWESGAFGPLLADASGFTLYRFDSDAKGKPSTCEGDCAANWPPVTAGGLTAGTGVDAALLGSVARGDGTEQLTVDGWPVYRFAGDGGPEQVNGQGVGDVWWAVTPEGKRADAGGAGGSGGGGDQAGGGDTALPDLSVVEHPEYGGILRDGKGRTLYRFTEDSAWPMASECTGDCLDNWPAATPADLNRVEGVDPELIDTFVRPDGVEQLVIDCWPLYWYAGDAAPGDTNGQGVGGTWYVVSPDGELVR